MKKKPEPPKQVSDIGSKRRTGRPPAKSSNPDYTQITAYIRKDTYTAVKRKLLDQDNPEFSETLEHLLNKWIEGAR